MGGVEPDASERPVVVTFPCHRFDTVYANRPHLVERSHSVDVTRLSTWIELIFTSCAAYG